jgi:hypothetical protein
VNNIVTSCQHIGLLVLLKMFEASEQLHGFSSTRKAAFAPFVSPFLTLFSMLTFFDSANIRKTERPAINSRCLKKF